MNSFSNLWKHPRTSVAGILISIATVTGILAQQGISFGHVGSGTAVSLAGALATALLGLVSRDPGSPPLAPATIPQSSLGGSYASNCTNSGAKPSNTAKLGAWLLTVLLLPLPWLEGCTKNQVARDIVNWTPSLQSAVATVDSTAAVLDPAAAPIFTAATSGFDAASNVLAAQASAYLAHPSPGTLAQLQAQVVKLQQQISASLLAAARIVNPASQQHAMAALQAVATIVTAILGLVQSISSKADVAHMAAGSAIKAAAVSRYLDGSRSEEIVAAHYRESQRQARQQIEATQAMQTAAGF